MDKRTQRKLTELNKLIGETKDDMIITNVKIVENKGMDDTPQKAETFYEVKRGDTLSKIANKFGITRERVRQIKEESIKKLRKNSNFLKELL